MGLPDSNYCEQDVHKFIREIAEIFFSEEFKSLRHELEAYYANSNLDNAYFTAFQDALFAILAQENKTLSYLKAYGE